jgi:hypothetical protein
MPRAIVARIDLRRADFAHGENFAMEIFFASD